MWESYKELKVGTFFEIEMQERGDLLYALYGEWYCLSNSGMPAVLDTGE